MSALAGLAGALVAAGLLLLGAEAAGRGPVRRLPGSRLLRPAPFSPADRNRAITAACAGLLILILTRWPVGGAAAAAGVLLLPKVASARAARQQTAVLEALEQWNRRIADLLTASRGLEDALQTSARQAPAVIQPAVAALSRRLASQAGTESALRAFADDIADPAGDRIAAALIIATGRRGGAVRGVLERLAAQLARDVAARREIEAGRAEQRTTVRWMIGLVAGFTIFAALDRNYAAPYSTTAGQGMLAVITGLYTVALWWLHRLSTTPAGGRILEPARRAGRQSPGGAQ